MLFTTLDGMVKMSKMQCMSSKMQSAELSTNYLFCVKIINFC